jgi:hypothetical protein
VHLQLALDGMPLPEDAYDALLVVAGWRQAALEAQDELEELKREIKVFAADLGILN